jgi:tetratricopeptide (TPR) repeat protein
LDQLGLSKDTLVMFSSDNGTARRSEGVLDGCGPFSGSKYSLQEGGIRVPMICRMPGTVPAGTVSAEPWYAADVLPTLAELAGAAPPAALDGISVLPLLTGRSGTLPERSLYWETTTKSFSQAARRGSHKAIRNWFSGKTALYDLASDPGETRDLAAAHPDLVASFEAFMASSHADSPHYPLMVAKRRDWEGEMAAFERDLQLKPQDAALLNHYAWFLVDTVPEELKDTTKALDLARKADAAAKGRNRDILDTLSEIHFQRRDYATAVEYSRKSLEPGLEGKAKPKALQKQLAKCEKALAEVRTTTP